MNERISEKVRDKERKKDTHTHTFTLYIKYFTYYLEYVTFKVSIAFLFVSQHILTLMSISAKYTSVARRHSQG